MAIIKHQQGIELEMSVRSVYNAQRFEMGGIINSDHFDNKPFEAALLALAPYYYNGIHKKDINNFLEKYANSYNYIDEIDDIDEFTEQFINDLNKLIKTCKSV